MGVALVQKSVHSVVLCILKNKKDIEEMCVCMCIGSFIQNTKSNQTLMHYLQRLSGNCVERMVSGNEA